MDPGGYLVHPGDYLVASGGYFRRILEVIWTGVCSRDASKNSELNMTTTSGDFFGQISKVNLSQVTPGWRWPHTSRFHRQCRRAFMVKKKLQILDLVFYNTAS